MDIEQLKLILEAFGNASDGAFTIAILWISQGYFVPLLTAITMIVIAVIIAKIIQKLNTEVEFVYELQRTIGASTGNLTQCEKEEIIHLVNKGQEAKKDK